MKPSIRLGARRLIALAVILLFLGQTSSAIDFGDMDPHETAQALVEESEILPDGFEQMLGTGSFLDLVGNLTGLSHVTTTGAPVESHVLGLTLPPSLLPVRYVADATQKEQPLQHALLLWNEALELQPEEVLLEDPEFYRAGELPHEAQVAVAALLYALTDATMLQADAIEGLDKHEIELLLGLPDALMALGGDPQDWVDDPQIGAMSKVAEKVDMEPILGATRLVAATVSHVMPVLEKWGEAQRAAYALSQTYVDSLDVYLERYSPDRLQQMHRLERIDALSDAMVMVGDWTQGAVPSFKPFEPAAGAALGDALRDLAGSAGGLGLVVPSGELDEVLVRADLLPVPLQQALARIVVNYQAWLEATMSFEGESDEAAVLVAAVRLVNAVKESAPTLEAFGLMYQHHGYPFSPKTALDARGSLGDVKTLAQGVVRDDSPVGAVHVGFIAQGADFLGLEAPVLPPRGALEGAVLDLYSRYGLEVDGSTRDLLSRGVENLDPVVERNTARILLAQLEATDRLSEFYQGLSEEDLAVLELGLSPQLVQSRILEGEVGLEEFGLIESYYDLAGRVRDAYYEASLIVALAKEAAKEDLLGEVESVGGSQRSWWQRAFGWLPRMSLVMTASAQEDGGACEAVAQEIPGITDCENDVLFMDPLLATVVVGGSGSTEYTPGMGRISFEFTEDSTQHEAQADIIATISERGQILSLDLGGDDVYRTNAGGSFLGFLLRDTAALAEVTNQGIISPRVNVGAATDAQVDPTAVSVALDLGGSDQYFPMEAGSGGEGLLAADGSVMYTGSVIQGASVGGIGMLWNVEGDDVYEAGSMAQGFGGVSTGASRSDLGPCDDRGIRVTTNAGEMEIGDGSPCLMGLFGVGILFDGDGDDHYQAEHLAQGAAVGGPFSGLDFFEEAGLLATFGALGVLADGAGDDIYELKQGSGSPGQGFGDAAVGILVDGSGDDGYLQGSQGRGVNGGVGLLVDLDGDDSYTRRNAYTNERFNDGMCRVTIDPGDESTAPGAGFFADLRGGTCAFNLADTLRDLSSVDPQNVVDSVVGPVLSAVDDVLTSIENMVDDLPDPEDFTNPPPGFILPPVCLDGIGIFALGDSTATTYEDDGCDYLLTVDLGGNDTYQNNAGGPIAVEVPLPTLLLSVGEGDDFFDQGGKTCVQGCDNGMVINLGGSNTYEANRYAQGAVTDSSDLAWGLTSLIGVLFDADGDDVYRTLHPSSARSQGYTVGDNREFSFAMLLDAGGDDVYESTSQAIQSHGSVGPSPPCSVITDVQPANNVGHAALFFDLQGTDHYQPVGTQGSARSVSSGNIIMGRCAPAVPAPPNVVGLAVFVDNDGWDTYRGRPGHPGGPDLSDHRNDRFEVDAGFTRVSGTQPHDGVALGISWDRDAGSTTVQEKAQNTSSELDLPGLGVAIGGPGGDEWDDDYALLVSLGGSNTYRNNAGATLLRGTVEQGTSSVTAAGSGPLAVASLLVSLGDEPDLYDGGDLRLPSGWNADVVSDDPEGAPERVDGVLMRPSQNGVLVQGAGFLGVGMLIDEGGDDVYKARGLSQGVGILGSGIVWSRGGDDTFAYRPDVVRNPALGGSSSDSFVAWEEMNPWALGSGGAFTWRPFAAHPDVATPAGQCTFSLLPESVMGPVKHLGVSPDGTTALMSRFVEEDPNPHWELRRVTIDPQDNCGPGSAIDEGRVVASGIRSDQLHATFGPGGSSGFDYIWQDDRHGNWNLFWARPDETAIREDLFMGEATGILGESSQTRPAISGNRLVFEDDRHGPSSIYELDLRTFEITRLSVDPLTGDPLPGEHMRPSASGRLVTWETRANEDEPWKVAVLEPSRDGPGTLRILDGGHPDLGEGENTEPVVSGSRVLFTHDAPDAEPRIVVYDWSADAMTLRESTGHQPAIHSANPSVMAWVDRSGPLHEIGWDRGARMTPTNTENAVHGTLMQGVAWQAGLGLLLNQVGLDEYKARSFAQGAAFSRGDPNIQTTPAGHGETLDANTNQGAFGVLLDLDGNDLYEAVRRSQGVHYGGQFESSPAAPGAQPVLDSTGVWHLEFVENAGLLVDLRGSDRYSAQQQSQGYSAFVLGKNLRDQPQGNPSPFFLCADDRGNDNCARDGYLINSIGALIDLGGTDEYSYGSSVTTLQELAEPDPQNLATCTGDMAGPVAEQWDAIRELGDDTGLRENLEDILFEDEEDPGHDGWQSIWALGQTIGELCGTIDEEVGTLWGGTVLPPTEEARSELFEDSGTSRNNMIWHQPTRATPEAGISIGGVGADLPAMDQLGHRLREIAEDALGVDLKAFRGGTFLEVVEDVSFLVTEVEMHEPFGQQLQIVLVETFIQPLDENAKEVFQGGFQGYSETDHCPEEVSGDAWCLMWDTDRSSVPDGEYEVTTRVHYGLSGPLSDLGSLGYVTETETLPVDNRPRISGLSVSSEWFSPHPYMDRGFDTPEHPRIGFALSPDPWVEGGDAFVEINVYDAEQFHTDENAEPVRTLRDFNDEPLPGQPDSERAVWDGNNDAGDPVVSGIYVIRVVATDDRTDPTRNRSASLEVRVDADTPQDGCVRVNLLTPCNPEFVPAPRRVPHVPSFPLTITAPSDVDAAFAHIFVNRTKPGDEVPQIADVEWDLEAVESFQAGTHSLDWALSLMHDEQALVLVLIEDISGNMECMPSCGAGPDVLDQVDPDEPLLEAVTRKVDLPGTVLGIWADYHRPLLEVMDEGRVYRINQEDTFRKPTPLPRVGPASTVEIHTFASEETSGIIADLRWETEESNEFETWISPAGVQCADATSPMDDQCPENRFRIIWDDWEGLLMARDWPEGGLVWEFDIKDGIGNPIDTRLSGLLVLDASAPEVQRVDVVYPSGESSVTQRGDIVTVEVQATDPVISGGRFPADPGAFTVLLDASMVTRSSPAVNDPSRIPMSYDFSRDLFYVTFPVNHDDLDLSVAGHILDLPLHIADEALNWNNESGVPLVVGTPELGLRFVEDGPVEGGEQIGVHDARLHFQTDVEADVALRFQIAGRSSTEIVLESTGMDHLFELEGLEAARLYTYRIEAVDEEGLQQSLGPFELATHAGLSASLDEDLRDGLILSGVKGVQGEVSVSSDPDAQPRVQIFMHNEGLPGGSRLISDDIARGGGFARDIVTGALPDGVYALEVRVSYESPVRHEVETLRVVELLVDNSPPRVKPVEPLSGATLASSPGVLVFEASDDWTPVFVDSARLRVNGDLVEDVLVLPFRESVAEPPVALDCPGIVISEAGDGDPWAALCYQDLLWNLVCLNGSLWTGECVSEDGLPFVPLMVGGAGDGLEEKFMLVLPGDLPRGDVRLTVTVKDFAGNTGVVTYSVFFDPDAPSPLSGDRPAVVVSYVDGNQAVRPGDAVRLRAELADASGIARVVVDAGPVGGLSSVALQGVSGGFETVLRVGDVVEGDYMLNVTATDKLGHKAVYPVMVRVLTEQPELVGFDAVATDLGGGMLGLAFSEPVNASVEVFEGERLVMRSLALAGDLSVFGGLAGARGVFGVVADVSGLEPGVVYRVVVEARDGAGHEVREEVVWRFAPVVVDPPVVGGLSADVLRGNRVQLAWGVEGEFVEQSVRFIVLRSDGDRFEPVGVTWGTQFEDEVVPGGVYRYFVQAENLVGALGVMSEGVLVEAPRVVRVTDWGVSPSRGVEGTPFTFRATVVGASVVEPVVWVVLEGVAYRMGLASGDCRVECEFTLTKKVPAVLRTLEQPFHIEVVDGDSTLKAPSLGEAQGPLVLPGGDEKGERNFAPALNVVIVLFVGLVIGIFKRRCNA